MINDKDFVAIAEAAILKDLQRLKDACKSYGEASKVVQDELKHREDFPQIVKDLFAAGSTSVQGQSEKRRRRF
eukprot:Skav219374  [mRNA]  locus=scaffold76:683588:683806:- [translate_table: standard]